MATRLYLPSSGAAAISPAFDAGWEDTTIAARLGAVTTAGATAMTSVSFTDADASDRDILFRQYVYGPIAAQTLSAQTVTVSIRGNQPDEEGGNMSLSWGVRVVSSDGSTVRGTMVGPQNRDSSGFESAPTLASRFDSVTSTQVVASAGDYIVIEIGTGGNPGSGSSHDSTLRIGDAAASDLNAADGDTDDDRPWVNFANTIASGASGTIAASLQKALFSGSGLQTAGAQGSVASILQAATFSATGQQPFSGTAAATLQAATFSASGTYTPPPPNVPNSRYAFIYITDARYDPTEDIGARFAPVIESEAHYG